MSQIGKISKIGVDKILKWAAKGEKTGAFVFTRKKEKKYLYFKGGKLLAASSNNPKERLGQVMLRAGMLTHEQIEAVQEVQRKKKKKFGTAVVELGFSDQEKLLQALHHQTKEIVLNLFDWEDGEFLFYLNKLPAADLSAMSHDLDTYIQEGKIRQRDWASIRRTFPSMDDIIELSFNVSDSEDQKSLNGHSFKILTLVDGFSTIAEIVSQSELDEFEAMKILYRLVESGQLAVKKDVLDELDEAEDTRLNGLGAPEVPDTASEGKLQFSSELDDEVIRLKDEGKLAECRELLLRHFSVTNLHDVPQHFLTLLKDDVTHIDNIPAFRESDGIEKSKKMDIDARTGFIMSRIDGKLSVKLLSNISGIPKESVQDIIFNLYCLGLIDVTVRSTKPQPATAQGTGTVTVSPGELSEEPTSEEEQNTGKIILDKYKMVAEQDYYEILEVEKNVEPGDLKKAYHALAKRFHPDMLAQRVKDESIKNCVNIIFDRIQLAYDTLSDPEKRANYDKAKGFNLTEEEQKKMARIKAKAGLQFQIGMKAAKGRQYKKAIEFIQSAIDIYPQETAYYCKLGEILAKNPKWRDRGISTVKKAIDIDPHDTNIYLTLGDIYTSMADMVEAEKYYRRALINDPMNEQAIQALKKMGKDIDTPTQEGYDRIISKDIALL